ncbi:NADAR family protein, partial [Acinetobacter baumannii]
MKDEKFLNDLIQKIQQGHQFKYLYFWGHTPKKANLIDKSCFSQWFPAQFNVEGIEYFTAEHYMMAQKAKLFNDKEIFAQILHNPFVKQLIPLALQESNLHGRNPHEIQQFRYDVHHHIVVKL